MAPAEVFNIGGDMQWPEAAKVLEFHLVTPFKEAHHSAMIGASGIRVPDGGDEKLDKPLGGGATC